MRLIKLFISILLLFLISGCHADMFVEKSESNIPIQTDLIVETNTPHPNFAARETIDAENIRTRIEIINDFSNIESSPEFIRKMYSTVYGEELDNEGDLLYLSVFDSDTEGRKIIYIDEAGEYIWNNKLCTLICVQYLSNGPFNAAFFLIDENEDILYSFSPPVDHGSFRSVYEVAYFDVDGNGYDDFIIIYECTVGNGRYPVARFAVYFGEDNNFYRDEDLEFEVNSSHGWLDEDRHDMDDVIERLQSKMSDR